MSGEMVLDLDEVAIARRLFASCGAGRELPDDCGRDDAQAERAPPEDEVPPVVFEVE